MENLENVVVSISKLAGVVAIAADQESAAIAARDDAEAELLTRAVNAALPALKALSKKVRTSYSVFWPDSVSTDDRSTYSDFRAIRLAGNGAERDYPRADSGSYGGEDLFLLDDGTFAIATYGGRWSRWQGASSSWYANFTGISALTVVQDYHVAELLSRLEGLLSEAANQKRETKQILETTSKIKAILALLK